MQRTFFFFYFRVDRARLNRRAASFGHYDRNVRRNKTQEWKKKKILSEKRRTGNVGILYTHTHSHKRLVLGSVVPALNNRIGFHSIAYDYYFRLYYTIPAWLFLANGREFVRSFSVPKSVLSPPQKYTTCTIQSLQVVRLKN